MTTMANTELVMCPICMDDILPNSKNFTSTECGHCFHTSCLMSNVAHNGFGCPYCREKMVENIEEIEKDHHDNYDDQYSEDSSYTTQEEEDLYNDDVLTSMRMLFQRCEGEEVEEQDQGQNNEDEDQDDQDEHEEEDEEEEEAPPSLDMVVRKLIGNGITYEDLVKTILLEQHEEYMNTPQFEVSSDKIFASVRMIVSNHDSQIVVPEPEPRFRNIFNTFPMPDFASMTTEEVKTICQDYGIRYRRSAVRNLTKLWKTHNPSIEA